MSDTKDILTQIAQQLDALPDYGQLQLHLKKHAEFGKEFSNTDVVKITPYKYNQNTRYEPNVALATDVMELMKSVTAAELTGQLTFSITFKKGKADQMTVQDFKKI